MKKGPVLLGKAPAKKILRTLQMSWRQLLTFVLLPVLAHVISCISCIYTIKRDDLLIDLGGKRALCEYYSCVYLDPIDPSDSKHVVAKNNENILRVCI